MAIVYLLAGVPAPGDDGDTADLEELHLVRRAVVLVGEVGLGCSVGWEVWNRGVIFSTKFRVVWVVENLGQVGEITCRYFSGCIQPAVKGLSAPPRRSPIVSSMACALGKELECW